MAMLDYNTKIMIEIQHGRQLRIVLDLANSSRDGQKLVQGHVESFLRNQCLDNFFEIEPPIVNNKGTTKKPLQAKTTEKGLEVKKSGFDFGFCIRVIEYFTFRLVCLWKSCKLF